MRELGVMVGLLVGLFFLASQGRATVVTYNFNDGTLGGLVVKKDPGFSVTVTNGVANVSESAGFGNGGLNLYTPFTITGDFTATVLVNRTGIGSCEAGLQAESPDDTSTLANIFFVRASNIASNIFRPTVYTAYNTANNAATMTLGLSRVGTTITETYNDGSGNVTHSQSHPTMAGPLKLHLFLGEEFGDYGAHAASFDNFTITADGIPEPATAGLFMLPALWMMMGRRRV